MDTGTLHSNLPLGRLLLVALVAMCALAGCWQEVYYDESDARPATSATAAAPAESPDTGPSPAERSDALSETALADAGRSGPPTADVAGEGQPPAADVAAPPAASPDEAGNAVLPGGSAMADDSGPPPQAAPSDTSSTSVDDLFGSLPTSAEPASPPAATAESTGPATPPETTRPSTRRLAWLLGSKWSLSVLAQDRGAPHDEIEKWFKQSQALARALGLTLPDLPAPDRYGSGQAGDHTALDYLFDEGQQVGRELADRYGPEHAALLELAVKSNILLVLYEPGASVTDAISAAIARAGSQAGLPDRLYEPLLKALADRASRLDVSQAVFHVHDAVDQYLIAAKP